VIDDLVAEGDLVADRIHLDGTQTGEFFDVPASGKPVYIGAIEEWRIAGGQVVEGWHVENLLQVTIQIGAIPVPGGEAASSPEAPPVA
jgi:predicted ester cyclase